MKSVAYAALSAPMPTLLQEAVALLEWTAGGMRFAHRPSRSHDWLPRLPAAAPAIENSSVDQMPWFSSGARLPVTSDATD